MCFITAPCSRYTKCNYLIFSYGTEIKDNFTHMVVEVSPQTRTSLYVSVSLHVRISVQRWHIKGIFMPLCLGWRGGDSSQVWARYHKGTSRPVPSGVPQWSKENIHSYTIAYKILHGHHA